MTVLLKGMCLFWFGVLYKQQLVSYSLKTVSKYTTHSQSDTTGSSVHVFRVWHVYSQATPGLLNTWKKLTNNGISLTNLLMTVTMPQFSNLIKYIYQVLNNTGSGMSGMGSGMSGYIHPEIRDVVNFLPTHCQKITSQDACLHRMMSYEKIPFLN